MNYSAYTIQGARASLKKKHFSSTHLVKACIDEIKEKENLNAFITVCEKEALKKATEADKKIKDGVDLPLLGIPISVKDIYLTKGIRTTAASKILDDFIPQYSATVVKKLEDVGAIIIGKTNCDAWAHGSSGENSDYGPTESPFLEGYVPGGSSSGSAVSVAAQMCFASMGSDTGGSIRLPASFCEIVGLKPTYGRVSRYGIIAMASSLDSIGHFTNTIEESALMLSITAGKDPNDATTPDETVDDYQSYLKKDIKGIRIGIPKEYFAQGLDKRIKEKIEAEIKSLEKQGAKIENISLPNTEYAIACYYIIQPAEVSSNLGRYDGIRYGSARQNFGEEAKRRIMLGTYVLSSGYYDAYYKKAMQIRTLIKKDFDEVFKKVDVVITPVSPTLPWKIGEKSSDPLSMYLSDVYTVTANLAGIPGISVPIGLIQSLPVGLQILGPHFSEGKLFQVGKAILGV
ncbi:MAG: aspartyl/glutamyl-tRNA amidotransferase subunit A [Candidatus Levybacteria bacterium RIFCSPHIGHO2_01_FULL_37_33]|nr:MAG: aspartyl/glutamyl-tRNA amidotransferase subunit A [Candidatus Levybacteria bacterium RIFCSPHIGHO2_01_FULL_37_33]OGH29080.1 MAG: aspartyl/glutamyl-tRNA amidotransferase subunit A [Candidatus Levybacteria bacterium RIFCSPHIGHO2_12_FULL_37_12]OGH33184.1 MAG: aspartyl/glutamyl-tRNA amidotransferase subunit A [Candidatus Levybacteria bacterium RIFCSPLOWO2_01_FULL_36_54]